MINIPAGALSPATEEDTKSEAKEDKPPKRQAKKKSTKKKVAKKKAAKRTWKPTEEQIESMVGDEGPFPEIEPELTLETCEWVKAPNGRIVRANWWHRREGAKRGFSASLPPDQVNR